MPQRVPLDHRLETETIGFSLGNTHFSNELAHKRIATDVNAIRNIKRVDVPSLGTLLVPKFNDVSVGLDFASKSESPSSCLHRWRLPVG